MRSSSWPLTPTNGRADAGLRRAPGASPMNMAGAFGAVGKDRIRRRLLQRAALEGLDRGAQMRRASPPTRPARAQRRSPHPPQPGAVGAGARVTGRVGAGRAGTGAAAARAGAARRPAESDRSARARSLRRHRLRFAISKRFSACPPQAWRKLNTWAIHLPRHSPVWIPRAWRPDPFIRSLSPGFTPPFGSATRPS